MTRSYMKELQETTTSGEGCKKDENIDRFYSRTAGMFYFFRPCGIRLGHFEMYTAESLSSIFLWIVDLFGVVPSLDFLRGIVYDRACDLLPFLQRLAKEGNKIAQNYINLLYIVDIFHCEKHTMPKCQCGDGIQIREIVWYRYLRGMRARRGWNSNCRECIV